VTVTGTRRPSLAELTAASTAAAVAHASPIGARVDVLPAIPSRNSDTCETASSWAANLSVS
jgi:hypothetical protein